MNEHAAYQHLADIAAQLRQLKGLAGSMNHHGAAIEALAHDIEVTVMAILAGVPVKNS